MDFRTHNLEEINLFNRNTLMEHLEMKCVEISEEVIKISMPVNTNTHQPMGLLHGGASAALIESIGSMGSALLLDLSKEVPVGLEINANHLSGVREGLVVAEGKLIHHGKRTHIWQVDIYSEGERKHVCTGRLTVMIIPRT